MLAKVPYIVSTPTINDGTLYPAVTSTLMTATATHAAYCNVQLTYTSIGSPGSSAPLQNTAYGYGTNENQAINIGIGLPLSAADTGTGGVQGAWNGRLQHLGGGGLVGSVGSTTSATDAGYVGSSTDTGHTGARTGRPKEAAISGLPALIRRRTHLCRRPRTTLWTPFER